MQYGCVQYGCVRLVGVLFVLYFTSCTELLVCCDCNKEWNENPLVAACYCTPQLIPLSNRLPPPPLLLWL